MIHLLWLTAVVLGILITTQPASPSRVEAAPFPTEIQLPDGWLPEGIATGNGPTLYSGSRRNGAIYEADLVTGEGTVIIPSQAGRMAVGMKFDSRTGYLFVAGGTFGAAHVYDTETAATVESFQFVTSGSSFVNDVIVTRDAAYFTESMRPVIYKVPLGPGGEVVGGFEEISLSGDYVHMTGFNANGIAATPDGDRLIIVQSGAGLLFNVDPETGVATTIDLGGYSVSAGDGLLLQGRTLYVARNQLNLIAEIQLDPDFLSGVMVNEITDPLFDIPTTLASFGNGLYAVNARFTSGMDPSLAYSVIRVER